MITPKDAAARRRVRTSDKYKQCEREIDARLCSAPNVGATWQYEVPALRDGGELKRALVEDYEKAGWRVTYTENHVTFAEPVEAADAPAHVATVLQCGRCGHAPHVGKCSGHSYNPITHESGPCRCGGSALLPEPVS